MNSRSVEAVYGNGRGKTAMAIGQGLIAAGKGQSVIMIQFMKGREYHNIDFIDNIGGYDIKVFRFEKLDKCYEDLTPEEKQEESLNIKNGVNFARKVIATQECDYLILDEILGLPDVGIIEEQTIKELLSMKDENMHIVMTGRAFPEGLRDFVDEITKVETELSNER